MPRRCAASLTGGAGGGCARPRGRSGCVTTSGISWPARAIASSVGTANAGVPRKISRIAGRDLDAEARRRGELQESMPVSGALKFFYLALHQVALEDADVGDVEAAVEVIGFVLEGARQQVFAGVFELLAR